MRKLCLAIPVLLLAGCAGMPYKESQIIEAGSAKDVQDCQLLKTFAGPGGYRMWGTPYLGNFKNEVLEKAKKMGATHILWRTRDRGIAYINVINVYRCPPVLNKVKEEEREE